MNFVKLSRRISAIFSAARRHERVKLGKLKLLLKRLKDEQRLLATQIETETDPAHREALALRLRILTEQRRKGVKLRRSLHDRR